jgi:hypothetical protein
VGDEAVVVAVELLTYCGVCIVWASFRRLQLLQSVVASEGTLSRTKSTSDCVAPRELNTLFSDLSFDKLAVCPPRRDSIHSLPSRLNSDTFRIFGDPLVRLIMIFCLVTFPAITAKGATTFNNEANFLGSAGSITLESFETLPATSPFPGVASIASGQVTITNSSATGDLDIWDQPVSAGHATHGEKYLVWYGQTTSATLTFTFPTPLVAFGVNIVDYGYPAHSTPMTFSTNAGDSGVAAVAIDAIDSEQFFGVLGSPFTSITFYRGALSDGVVFDEIYFRALPEPTAVALTGIAIAGLVAQRRRNHPLGARRR